MQFNVNDIKNSACAGLNQHIFAELPKDKKKSKYGNKIVTYDGIRFDSIKEKNRYIILRLLEKAGEISNLRLQVKYVLEMMNAKIKRKETYIADFVYWDNFANKEVVEDTKGHLTTMYKRKRKWMLEFYGIEILET